MFQQHVNVNKAPVYAYAITVSQQQDVHFWMHVFYCCSQAFNHCLKALNRHAFLHHEYVY